MIIKRGQRPPMLTQALTCDVCLTVFTVEENSTTWRVENKTTIESTCYGGGKWSMPECYSYEVIKTVVVERCPVCRYEVHGN